MRYGLLVPLLLAVPAVLLAACGRETPSPPPPTPPVVADEAAPTETPAPTVVPAARADERGRMVERQIAGRGVRDPLVLAAMRRVPRHLFVPDDLQDLAYADRPLPIGLDQTISQPYVVASMTEEAHVHPGSKVLEIGTGSGYQAAVLAAITDHVYTIEIKQPLVTQARANLDAAGFGAVKSRHGDGYYGWVEHAPFDAIVVTAAAPHVPPPLVEQLAPGGRMVIPVGEPMAVQDLLLVTKDEQGEVRTKSLYPVRFVPLTGAGVER